MSQDQNNPFGAGLKNIGRPAVPQTAEEDTRFHALQHVDWARSLMNTIPVDWHLRCSEHQTALRHLRAAIALLDGLEGFQ